MIIVCCLAFLVASPEKGTEMCHFFLMAQENILASYSWRFSRGIRICHNLFILIKNRLCECLSDFDKRFFKKTDIFLWIYSQMTGMIKSQEDENLHKLLFKYKLRFSKYQLRHDYFYFHRNSSHLRIVFSLQDQSRNAQKFRLKTFSNSFVFQNKPFSRISKNNVVEINRFLSLSLSSLDSLHANNSTENSSRVSLDVSRIQTFWGVGFPHFIIPPPQKACFIFPECLWKWMREGWTYKLLAKTFSSAFYVLRLCFFSTYIYFYSSVICRQLAKK